MAIDNSFKMHIYNEYRVLYFRHLSLYSTGK